ncbi:hypothetical protein Tco_0870294 [Tanacetum coccineum]
MDISDEARSPVCGTTYYIMEQRALNFLEITAATTRDKFIDQWRLQLLKGAPYTDGLSVQRHHGPAERSGTARCPNQRRPGSLFLDFKMAPRGRPTRTTRSRPVTTTPPPVTTTPPPVTDPTTTTSVTSAQLQAMIDEVLSCTRQHLIQSRMVIDAILREYIKGRARALMWWPIINDLQPLASDLCQNVSGKSPTKLKDISVACRYDTWAYVERLANNKRTAEDSASGTTNSTAKQRQNTEEGHAAGKVDRTIRRVPRPWCF